MDVTRFGRYGQLELLGQGGMARVYKAYDPNLGRYVALKLLRIDDAQTRERFLMEAKTQARIEHEHVCRVYEAGEVDGNPYIAMQYIPGKTLKELRLSMGVEQKAKLMMQVAEAVHEAHRLGMIHRDIKPANIMAVHTEQGEWAPYVMDFGLAREVGSEGMTQSGVLVGTLMYMSPEQARGDRKSLDRRSDVYSIGVTFYEMVTGRLPFEMEGDMDFILNVIDESTPAKPMDPRIPADLRTIVMKCLEKEPGRRYDSAKALGEDVQRYLDGEPIQARPTGLFHLLWKKARKHRVAVGLGTASLLLLAVLLGAWLQSRREMQQRARLAQQLEQEVEQIEARLRYAYLLPLHDVRPERKNVLQKMKDLQTRLSREGKLASGLADTILGRGYLALHDYELAQVHLEWAKSHGDDSPELKYALAKVLGALYQKELEAAERQEDPILKKQRLDEIDKDYRRPALQYLRESSALNRETATYDEALISYYKKDYPDALEKASAAADRTPWLYEARILQGNVYVTMANGKRDQGANGEALALYQKAEEAYRNAIRNGESDPTGYSSLCGLKSNLMRLQVYQSAESPEQTFQDGSLVCNQALVADAGDMAALENQAKMYFGWGEYQLYRGEDPQEAIQASIAAAEKAVSLHPEDPSSREPAGLAYRLEGLYEMAHRRDPGPAFQQAIRHFDAALSVDRNSPSSLHRYAEVYFYQAEYEMEVGKDPRESLKRSIASLQKALQHANSAELHSHIALAYSDWAEYESDNGEDPASEQQQAISHAETAVRLNPTDAAIRNDYGWVFLAMSEYLSAAGEDPSRSIGASIDSMEKSVEINPHMAPLLRDTAQAYVYRGEYELEMGGTPQESVQKAKSYLARAFAVNQYDRWQILSQGYADLLEARWKAEQGKTPQDSFVRVQKTFDRLVQMYPEFADAWELGAWCSLYEAQWKISRGESAAALLRNGVQRADQMLKFHPEWARAYWAKGELLLMQHEYGKAAKALENALKRNRNLQKQIEESLQRARKMA